VHTIEPRLILGVEFQDELNSFPILQYTKLPAGEYLARVSRESTAVNVIP